MKTKQNKTKKRTLLANITVLTLSLTAWALSFKFFLAQIQFLSHCKPPSRFLLSQFLLFYVLQNANKLKDHGIIILLSILLKRLSSKATFPPKYQIQIEVERTDQLKKKTTTTIHQSICDDL